MSTFFQELFYVIKHTKDPMVSTLKDASIWPDDASEALDGEYPPVSEFVSNLLHAADARVVLNFLKVTVPVFYKYGLEHTLVHYHYEKFGLAAALHAMASINRVVVHFDTSYRSAVIFAALCRDGFVNPHIETIEAKVSAASKNCNDPNYIIVPVDGVELVFKQAKAWHQQNKVRDAMVLLTYLIKNHDHRKRSQSQRVRALSLMATIIKDNSLECLSYCVIPKLREGVETELLIPENQTIIIYDLFCVAALSGNLKALTILVDAMKERGHEPIFEEYKIGKNREFRDSYDHWKNFHDQLSNLDAFRLRLAIEPNKKVSRDVQGQYSAIQDFIKRVQNDFKGKFCGKFMPRDSDYDVYHRIFPAKWVNATRGKRKAVSRLDIYESKRRRVTSTVVADRSAASTSITRTPVASNPNYFLTLPRRLPQQSDPSTSSQAAASTPVRITPYKNTG